MNMARLTKHLKIVRDEELCRIWKNRKNEITMKELAEIFQIDLPRVYQILKEDRENKLFTKFKK